MKSATGFAIVMVASLAVISSFGYAATEGDDKQAIANVLSAYNKALNASSTADVLPLYAEDGVFMPPYSQAAVGTSAVRKAYDDVFKAITLNVKFDIAETVLMTPDWAFVRTNSSGHTTVHSTGAVSAEGNQELFVFKKQADGKWKIERYSFSSTNPAPQ